MKRALITGITGQDGSYLAELLLSKGYEVHGTLRRSSSFNTGRIDHIFDDLRLVYADMTDPMSLVRAVQISKPDEIYNLAAQSHVRTSFDIPSYTADATAMGTLHLLEANRDIGAKFYQASSSEMFGSSPAPQSETTPFHPRSPYGVSKAFAHNMCVNYRESYGMFVACGILFNHESHRRGETFVTRKITKAAARIRKGLQDKLFLGNLDAQRDWGYAPEFVDAMWRMLQLDEPDDFVIATGVTNTVDDFLFEVFDYAGLDIEKHVVVDPRYFRPSEVDILQGDYSKAERILKWWPRTGMTSLAKIMFNADLGDQ